MAEIYQLPDSNGGSTVPSWVPFLNQNGNNGFLNGNGWGGGILGFILGLLFGNGGWGNGFGGGFGNNAGGAGFISNQLNNDSGRELIMNAVTTQGEASRTAIQTLATSLGQDFNLVNSAVQNVQNTLANIATQQGMSTLQVVNAIQSGNATLASQLSQSCCSMQRQMESASATNQLAICQQTNTLQNGATSNTQALLNKLDQMQTQALQDKLDAVRAENARLSGEISQANQNNTIAGMIANAVNPLAVQLSGIRSEVDAIKRCQPSTITLPNNSMTAVPTIWANAVADNIVDKISVALNNSTTTTTTTA